MVKAGYKQTEIGVIPEDWEVKSYDDVFEFLTTATYSRAQLVNDGVIQYLHYGDIHTKYHFTLDLDFSTLPSVPQVLLKRYPLLKDGDIVMADASEDYEGICKSIEIKNIKSKKVIAGLHTFLLRDTNNFFVNGFKAYLSANHLIRQQYNSLATGMKVFGVSKGNLKNIQIPIPPKEEQKAIAEALGDTDALITSLEKLIAKKERIKQGTMQQLLTGKKRLEGFSGAWEEKRLGEIAHISRGASPRPIEDPKWFDYNSNVGWVRISDISKTTKFLYQTVQKLSRDGINHSRFVEANNLIMSICATLGKPILTKLDTCIHDGFVVFNNLQIDREFLYYFLFYIEKNWAKSGQTGSQMNLNTDLINTTIIMLPPTAEEQQAIAQILSDMDNELEALKAKLTKTKAIKEGMMSELLTGKTRLNGAKDE